jgi:hypothetical protein
MMIFNVYMQMVLECRAILSVQLANTFICSHSTQVELSASHYYVIPKFGCHQNNKILILSDQ